MNDAPQQHEQEKLNGSIVTDGNEKVAAESGKEVGEQKGEIEYVASDVAGSTIEAEKSGEGAKTATGLVEQGEQDISTNKFEETGAEAQDEAKAAVRETDKPSTNAEPASATTDPEAAEGSATAQLSVEAPAALPSPSHTHNSLRPLSPSSRTSTPPLTGTIAPVAKKFSAINVNKKFLSKTGTSPSPSSASPSTKLNPLSNRPAASPVPIAAPSRLLSTKLTTVSSTKPSTSPQPPSSASTSSPWAKPSLPPTGPGSSAFSAQQSSHGTTNMGGSANSQGAGGSARPAWRAVNADGKRPAMGMSRDFPTAKEVADGKQASVTAAQAQAAQAAAILQGLDAFSHLDPNAHRWDDDDDEDDVIDFGGDPLLFPPPVARQPPPQQQTSTDKPVSKQERFAEDFDRSWPRSAQQAAEEAQRAPDLRKRESDRVLFNASSNRLENPSSRPQQFTQPPQPTRLMSRGEHAPAQASVQHTTAPTAGRGIQRQPPPHLANASDTGRQLPPHMADSIPSRPPPPSTSQQQLQSGRIPWSNNRDNDRPLPPHMAHRADSSSAFESSRSPPTGPGSGLPPRRSFGQTTSTAAPPPQPHPHSQPQSQQVAAPAVDPTDSQAAEMHSAAEKARLRREAEEVERKAAAERAKQKAREMEAKFKSTPAASADTPLPPAASQTPSYTIAQRPKPPVEPTSANQNDAIARRPSVNAGPMLRRPSIEQPRGGREDQWRVRNQQPSSIQHDQTVQQHQGPSSHRAGRPTAESFFESDQENSPPQPILQTPQQAGPSTSSRVPTDAEVQALFDDVPGEESGKTDYMFDDTLARIKAAMGGSNAGKGGLRGVSESSPTPAAPAPQNLARPQPTPDDFSITQPAIPRSPPPAWRTFVVKLPKESKPVPVISQPQLAALKRTRQPARGWLMSFNPPLDLPSHSLSRTDLLLPGSNSERFARDAPISPLVSVSKGSLKKDNRSSAQSTARQTDVAHAPTAHQLQSRSAGRWRQTEDAGSTAPEPVSTRATIDLLDPPAPVPAKSPVKPAQTPVAQSDQSARYEGVNMGPSAKTAAAASDTKSGVRFMVSSELEGDSLLDEVNKMSLETVEEAEMKQSLGTGIETPKSPVSHNGPNASSLPNGTWNTSHEHLKNVWQTQQSSDPQSSGQSAVPDPVTTPLYPSLNPPSATDTNATQTNQLSYSSRSFSPSSASLLRQSPAVGYGSSPNNTAEGMASYARNQTNGYSSMGLWSAPGFGSSSMGTPGYGYTAKSPNAIDQKAAMAFNSAAGGGSPYVYGQSGGYTSLPSTHSPYGQFSSSQSRAPSTSNYAGYTQNGGRSMPGRFANGGNEFGQVEGSYYGYVGGGQSANLQQQQTQQQAQSQVHGMYYQTPSPGQGAGAVGQQQASGQRRKMW